MGAHGGDFWARSTYSQFMMEVLRDLDGLVRMFLGI